MCRFIIATALVTATIAAAAPTSGPAPAPADQGSAVVLQCRLDGTVDAGMAAYLKMCVEEAQSRRAEALLVTLDTPGGSLESTRLIVRDLMASEVPVLVWVGPSGARAGSAGVFVTLASHLAAMAPGTNIGAAHPVTAGGQDPEKGGEHMARKVENDTIAFVEAIARQRDRNVEWAVAAVKDSVSAPADRAVELGVVEFVSPSAEAFLRAADGRRVALDGGTRTLRTADAQVEVLSPTLSQRVVHWLANPAVAYVLFLMAMLGIAIELSSPGLVVPGVLGIAAFLLSMVAFSSLPIHAGAVALLVLGVCLIAGELFVSSGLLGTGGVILLGAGGLLLVDRFDSNWLVDASFGVPERLVVPTVLVLGGLTAWVAMRAARARKVPHVVGSPGMIGETGRALTDITPSGGEVFTHGERWGAVSPAPVHKDAQVVIRRVEGLTLHVEEVHA